MQNTIICGFSGIGKTMAAQAFKERVIDMESSKYSKLSDGRQNIEFPNNYVEAIKKEYEEGEDKIILISCHSNVRAILTVEHIPFVIIYPKNDRETKNEYMIRWLARGSSIDFIRDMDQHWSSYIMSCETDNAPSIYLTKDQFLVDILRRTYLHRR